METQADDSRKNIYRKQPPHLNEIVRISLPDDVERGKGHLGALYVQT